MAKIIFDGSTDYDEVYSEVKRMYSQINTYAIAQSPISISLKETLDKTASILLITDIDKESNTERYQSDVKSMYKLLYPYLND